MLIKFDRIYKEFSNGVVTKVLFDISVAIDKGEFVSIMGPSGSGKSTLMHIMGFLDRPTSGNYSFKGEDVTDFDDVKLAGLRNSEIGFVFQSFNLLSNTTVFNNVKLPLLYNKSKDKDKKVHAALKAVGLDHRTTYFANQLSGGEKQRVAIARALVNDPEIVFADEPTGNLDSKSGIQIMKILQNLNREGKTVILVTHETYTAEHAKRLIKIIDGKIVDDHRVDNARKADGEKSLK